MRYLIKNIQLEDLIQKLESFKNFDLAKNENYIEKYNNWFSLVDKTIKKHIFPDFSDLANYFDNYRYNIKDENSLNFYYSDKEFESINEYELYTKYLKESKYTLRIVIDYLKISNLNENKLLNVKIRSTEDKIDLLLEKLNFLFSDDYYSISTIFDLNSIVYRTKETEEIAENLFKRKYITKHGGEYENTDFVKITVKGSAYIERKLKSKNKKVKDENLDKKLDEVLLRLQKLGFGQEIIFNETEELRELQTKLSKKSWGQLLKGKLFDLALEKIIDTDTVKLIYEYLTNSDFKLIE